MYWHIQKKKKVLKSRTESFFSDFNFKKENEEKKDFKKIVQCCRDIIASGTNTSQHQLRLVLMYCTMD